METAVKWMYSFDGTLSSSLMNTEEFRDIAGNDIWRRMDFIRRVDSNAAHTGKKITKEQAENCVLKIYIFLWILWLAVVILDFHLPKYREVSVHKFAAVLSGEQ